MKAQLALCMKYMPAPCMKSLTLTHEGLEFGFAKFPFIELCTQTLGQECTDSAAYFPRLMRQSPQAASRIGTKPMRKRYTALRVTVEMEFSSVS